MPSEGSDLFLQEEIMLRKSTQRIVTALFVSAALIGWGFFERYGGPIRVPVATFYVFAAIIWVSPTAYRILRCKGCGNKASNLG